MGRIARCITLSGLVALTIGSPLGASVARAACPSTSTGQVTSTGNGQAVSGTLNGSSKNVGFAGVIFATIGSQTNVPAFCINLVNHIAIGDCFNTGGPTSSQITWLLNHGFGPDNSQSASENASRQAAVWYFSDSFITTDSHQTRVQQIIDAVPANPDPNDDVPQLTLEPSSAVNVLPGNTVHSLTVTVTMAGQPLAGRTVMLSTDFGALSANSVVTGAAGTASVTLTNVAGTANTAHITATLQTSLPAGTVFEPVVTGKQKLVLATPSTATVVANATKQWVVGGTIVAHKFLDSNSDTLQNSGEPSLASWTMRLFQCSGACDGSGCAQIATAVTDSSGNASFGSRAAGCYRVDEVFPAPESGHQGWHNTTPAQQLFALAANQATQISFGNIIFSVVVVQKFHDANANGQQDSGEGPLDGWRMSLERLVSGSWIPLADGLTDGGQAVFSDLPPGRYRVTETLQAGWVNTTGNPTEFDLGADSVVTTTFGNMQPVCGNGTVEPSEQCDDGNTAAGDCCSASCQLEPTGNTCTDDGNVCTNDQCDATGVCQHSNNTASCDDGNACTQTDTCQAGSCLGSNPVTCGALDQCHVVGVCDTGTGVCSNPAKADGSACTDGDACTQTDTCQAGSCLGSNPVTCGALDQCHVVGVCDTGTGVCSNPAKADGSACADGDACTQSDTCQAGSCLGSNPVTCAALDQCHVAGVCDTGTGVCSNPAKANGSACADGNACTQTDTCQAGTCAGSNPVTCTALDQCHIAGVCDTGTGVCSNPAKANGSTCADGNACTQTDTCQAGTCAGSNPVTCTALDQCHAVGVCNTGTGVCSNPVLADGSTCADGNACTQTDTCQTGSCVGSNPVTCTALDQCHVVGVCNSGSGACSNPPAANGTTCSDGQFCTIGDACTAGTCGGASPRDCSAFSDQCNVGVCSESASSCVAQPANEGLPCNDGEFCSVNDLCAAGACGGGPRNCGDTALCTTDTCNESSDLCLHTLDPSCCGNEIIEAGEGCDDGNAIEGDGCETDCTESQVCNAAPNAVGTTRYVNDGGGDGTPSGCATAAFTSVQAAVNAAAAGDVIAICPGTYGAVTVSQEVSLESTDGPSGTTINGGANPAVVIGRSAVRVAGLTLRSTTTAVGAEAICPLGQATCATPGARGSNVTIAGNVMAGSAVGIGWAGKIDCVAITDNQLTDNGQHVQLRQTAAGNPAVLVEIGNNTLTRGGSAGPAVEVAGMAARLTTNTIRQASGAGVWVGGAAMRMEENAIADNGGDGVTVTAGAEGSRIQNNNITGNAVGLGNDAAAGLLDATENWWGSQAGPFEATQLPGGLGNAVVNRSTGSTQIIEFLCRPAPEGFPSQLGVCGQETPELRQLSIGRSPDTSWGNRFIAFESSADLNLDLGAGVSNADGSPEVFLLDRFAARRLTGVCLGGANPGAPCTSRRRHCPGVKGSDPLILPGYCTMITQVSDTSPGAQIGHVRLTSRAQHVAYETTSDPVGANPAGASQVVRWDRRNFVQQRPGVTAQMTTGGAGQASQNAETMGSGRWVVMESAADPVGLNADGNGEIFLLDSRKGEWFQVTDTQAPVENRRPDVTLSRRMFFDSTGDLDNDPKTNVSNADGNRELFTALLTRTGPEIRQLTDTVAPVESFSGSIHAYGQLLAFSSTGNLDTDPATALTNVDGTRELFVWTRVGRREVFTQLTAAGAGESANPVLTPRGRYVVFESTADLENTGATNRRIFQWDRAKSRLQRVSRSRFGENQHPRVGRRFTVWESTADLTGYNPGHVPVLYLLDRQRNESAN